MAKSLLEIIFGTNNTEDVQITEEKKIVWGENRKMIQHQRN